MKYKDSRSDFSEDPEDLEDLQAFAGRLAPPSLKDARGRGLGRLGSLHPATDRATNQRRGDKAFKDAFRRLRQDCSEVFANINSREFRESLRSDFAAEIEALGGSLTPKTSEAAKTLEREIYALGKYKLTELRRVTKTARRLTAVPTPSPGLPPPRGKRGPYLRALPKRALLFEFVIERVVRLGPLLEFVERVVRSNPLLDFSFDTEGEDIPWTLLEAEWKRFYLPQAKGTLKRRYFRARLDAAVRARYAGLFLQDLTLADKQHQDSKRSLADRDTSELPQAEHEGPSAVLQSIRGERGLYLRNRSAKRTDLLNHRLSINASLAARKPPTTYAEYRDSMREGEKLLEPLRPMQFFTDAFPPKQSKGTQAAKTDPFSDEAWSEAMRRGIRRLRAKLAAKRSAQTSSPKRQPLSRTKAKASRRARR